MPITYIDHLIRRAHRYWAAYDHLPVDEHMEMEVEGLNVAELERQFYATYEGTH